MTRELRAAFLVAFAALWVAGASIVRADEPPAAQDREAAEIDAAMTARIDELLSARWAQAGITPAAQSDDAELLRRLYLDLTGTIPPVADVQAFLDDAAPDKRRRLVDDLLASASHVTHLADVWRDLMLPRKFDPQQAAGVIGLQNWLRRQFADNRRYDRIVADLLVATGGDESGPALFYTAVGLKPEELGTSTARIFLGIRLDCAQCHNHPFDRWTQEDFWGYAAFFAQLQQRSGNASDMRLVDVDGGEVKLPESETIVPTRYPGGVVVPPRERGTRRQQLAIWMVSRDNPYLAPAAVNLVWAELFGRGLVEPLDDFGPHNPPSHPQLMDALAEWFVSTGYDLRRLYRVLANSEAYQLSSRIAGGVDPAPELFARMAVKTMSAEQVYDSLSQVGLRQAAEGQDRLADPRRQAFLVKMLTQTRTATDFEWGVPQALTLMNGAEMVALTTSAEGGLLAALEAPFLDNTQRVEMAFLGSLARRPTDAERSQFVEYLQTGPAAERQRALGDIVWALVNSAEFMLNH
ncbi:MAG: DUF1549 and DUF1553 domain-containing protein [Pirellulales bacterium]